MNEKLKKFPIRPRFYEDESLSGYLFRLSKENHFLSTSYFAKPLNLTYSQLYNNEFSKDTNTRLYRLSGKSGISMLNSCLRIQSNTKKWYKKVIFKNKVKYCPFCIHEKYYHRLSWFILPLQMCLKHFVLLQEECPGCGSIINLKDFINRRCSQCQFCFLDVIPTQVNHIKYQESQKNLFEIFLRDKTTIFSLALEHYLKLAFSSFLFINGLNDFTGYFNEPLNVFFNRKNEQKSGYELSVAFLNVEWMYSDFPEHFYYVLDRFLQEYKGMKRYNALLKFEGLLEDRSFKELKIAYQKYCLAKLHEGVIRKDASIFKQNPKLLIDREQIRREEVKRTTGLTYEKLQRLANSNVILMEKKEGGGQKKYLINQDSLNDYLMEEENWITKKEAGIRLGVNTAIVQQLIDNGLLTASTKYSARYKRVMNEEVKQLLEQCRGPIVKEIPSTYFSFHDALIKYSVNGLTICKMIQFTSKGDLIPIAVKTDGTLADNFYDIEELNCCIKKIKSEYQKKKGYYFTDLKKILHVGEKRLWKILNEQNIEPDFTIYLKDGRRRYLFKKETAEKIRGILVWTSHRGKKEMLSGS